MAHSKAAVVMGGLLGLAGAASAQYSGDQQFGLAGLDAGSMPPPGIYLILPLYYHEGDISIHDAQGNQILKNISSGVNLFALPSVDVVTPYKILGATYGASFFHWVLNQDLNVASIGYRRATGYGYGDVYVQPAILGWHFSRADVTTAYAFFAPTGGSGHGLQMWVNEFDLGGTFFADKAKQWSLSSMAYFDFNHKKQDAYINVGDILVLVGGVGRSFRKGALNVGVNYDAQWKLSHDGGVDIPATVPISNGRLFAVGPEVDYRLFVKGANLGQLTFRYLWDVGAKTNFSGQILTVTFTFGHLFIHH